MPVAQRAALGVSAVLLAVLGLATGTLDATQRSPVRAEQLQLRLDPDAASRQELMLLPRIGPVIADHIIEYREALRPGRAFRIAEDLENVRRIGPLTVARLRPLLRFPPERADAGGIEVASP